MQNRGENWDNYMFYRTGYGLEDPCFALGSAVEQLCLSQQVRELWLCSQWMMLSKGQSGHRITSSCLRGLWQSQRPHFQLVIFGTPLMQTSCASVTFRSISTRCGFVPKHCKFSISNCNSKILVDQKSVISQRCYTTCSVYIPQRCHKMGLTFLSFLIFMLDSWIQRVCRGFLTLSCLSPIPSPCKGKICATLLGQAKWGSGYEVLPSWLAVYPKILGFLNRWNISLKWLTSLEITSYDTLTGFKFSESSYKYFTFMSCSRKYLFLQTPFQDSSAPIFTLMKSSGAVSFFILPGSSYCPLTGVSVTESDYSLQWEQSCHSCQCKNPTELWCPAELAWQMQMWGCCSVQHLPLAIFGHF